jgi:hypothetical protein
MNQRSLLSSPPAVAIAGWFVPGAGYVLIGDVTRGLVIGITILALFLGGVLIAGIRVIDVPGYDALGHRVLMYQGRRVESTHPDYGRGTGQWALTDSPFGEIIRKPWFVAQVLSGPIAIVGGSWSVAAAQPQTPGGRIPSVPMSHARLLDIGALYTAIAGIFNLLAMMDAASRAGRRVHDGFSRGGA